MKWICCFSKNGVIEVNNTEETIIQTIQPIKSPNFIPPPTNLDTISSVETLSDSDTVIATIGNSYNEIKEVSQNKDIFEDISIEPVVLNLQKKLKYSSKYTMGKNMSYFYLSTDRYYFIKNKNDNKDVFFGKFLFLDKSKNTLVTGRNSAGKSSLICDSIIFALYGKPYRKINLPQIVNSINKKGCLVEISFKKANEIKASNWYSGLVAEIARVDGEILTASSLPNNG
jgi:hypothetical protein